MRPIDEEQKTWEISHDFLVPLLDSIVARWRVSLWRKTRPWLPWVVAACMVVTVVAGMNWRKDAIPELTEMGWTVQRTDKGFYLEFAGLPPFRRGTAWTRSGGFPQL